MEQAQLEIQRLEELKKKEEEEVRRLRKQMAFKASKIRKFKLVIPEATIEEIR
jgi:Targeting protein for Xklp2 (TPX2) domain